MLWRSRHQQRALESAPKWNGVITVKCSEPTKDQHVQGCSTRVFDVSDDVSTITIRALLQHSGPYLHHVGQAIVQNEVVSHPDPVRLHGVTQPIVEPSNFGVVEVCHLRRNKRGRQFSAR